MTAALRRRQEPLVEPDTAYGPLGLADAGLEKRSRVGALLSVVVPVHDEEAALDAFFAAVTPVLDGLGVFWELVFIDDGSQDRTLALLAVQARRDRRVRVLSLARNFGKENALTAGLDCARGRMVVVMDVDLQDPPALIADFVSRWEDGYDVVYGERLSRDSDTWLKRTTAGAFYRVFNSVSGVVIPERAGDFRLLDRAAVEAFKALPERNRFNKGLFAWIGFPTTGVGYVRPLRSAGGSSWRYGALWNFALDGITSFSTLPLRVWSVMGLGVAAAALLWAAALVVRVFVQGRDTPGYASLMVVMLVGFALQMAAFGVLGEYVGRLYQEVKGRPHYIVRRRFGFEEPNG